MVYRVYRTVDAYEEGPADRVLFCTDAPMRAPIPQLGWVVYSRIAEADKEKILGGNMLLVPAHAGVLVGG